MQKKNVKYTKNDITRNSMKLLSRTEQPENGTKAAPLIQPLFHLAGLHRR